MSYFDSVKIDDIFNSMFNVSKYTGITFPEFKEKDQVEKLKKIYQVLLEKYPDSNAKFEWDYEKEVVSINHSNPVFWYHFGTTHDAIQKIKENDTEDKRDS